MSDQLLGHSVRDLCCAHNGARLKVGLVLHQHTRPVWVRNLLQSLRENPGLDVHVVATSSTILVSLPSIPFLTRHLYRLGTRRFDPFRQIERIYNDADEQRCERPDRESLIGAGFDLVICLPGTEPHVGPCGSLARYGVVTVRLSTHLHEPPYCDEMPSGAALPSASLYWHSTCFERARLIQSSELSTNRRCLFTGNARLLLAAVVRMLTGLCREIAVDPGRWTARVLTCPEELWNAPPAAAYPSNRDCLGFMLRQCVRITRLQLHRRGRHSEWFVALRRQASPSWQPVVPFRPEGFSVLPKAQGSQMADPFLITAGGETWLFFEEVPPGSRKGRIACARVNSDLSCSDFAVVLEKEHHLSYPCVFATGKEIFLLPESSGSRTVDLYRARQFPFDFKFEATLSEGIAAVDTTPFELDGRWYWFTTVTNPLTETHLFWSDTLAGPWRMHPRSPISYSVTNSRSAGHLFYSNGRLFRPTQDCGVRYGYGINLNEITRLTSTEFEEHRVDYIGPVWMRGLLGTHTLNRSGSFEVLDGRCFGRPGGT